MPTLRPRHRRRAHHDPPLYPTPPSPFSRHPPAAPQPPHLSPSTPSDHILRDLAILSITAAFALTFLNLFLYTAILFVGLIAPAWQTFKALERRHFAPLTTPASTRHLPEPVHTHSNDPFKIEQEKEQQHNHNHNHNDDNDDNDDDDDDADLDWLPPSLHPRQRPLRAPVAPPAPPQAPTPAAAPEQLHNWQAYWVMAALLFALDGLVSPFITTLLPRSVYAAGVFSAVTWLTRNRGGNAAALYLMAVRPVFLRSEQTVDSCVSKMLAAVEVGSREAVSRVGGIVEPAMRGLERAAEAGRTEMGAAVERRSRRRFLR